MIAVRLFILLLFLPVLACETAPPAAEKPPMTDAEREARVDALLDPLMQGLKETIGKKTAGIASFTKQDADYEPRVSGYLVPRFIDRLVRDGVTLVERRDLDEVVREIERQLSDLVDEETAVEAGHIFGVQLLVLGMVQDKSLSEYRIHVKVLDVETAAIVWTGSADLPRQYLPVKYGGV